MRNKMGFTLMELMVVLAIFAVVTSLAVPSLIGWRNDAKLRDGASLLRGDLERAKLRAIKENDFVAMLFSMPAGIRRLLMTARETHLKLVIGLKTDPSSLFTTVNCRPVFA